MYFSDEMPLKSFIVLTNNYKKTQPITVAPGHFHSITFRTSGKKVITDENGKVMVSEKGSVTYIPKNVGYVSDTPEGGSMYSLHFELEYEDPKAEAFVFTPKILSASIFENAFKSLYESYNISSPRNYDCMAQLYSLLALIKKETEQNSNVVISKRMATAKAVIDKSFADTSLTVEALARESGVSEAYFRHEFKICFGRSPVDYIRNIRIENAKLLLRSGLYSVSETAIESGFDSISYFSSTFKKLCGITPTEYASQMRKNKELS